jgi:hypothetical protein
LDILQCEFMMHKKRNTKFAFLLVNIHQVWYSSSVTKLVVPVSLS